VHVGPDGRRRHDRRVCAQSCLSLRSGAPRRDPPCIAACPDALRVVGQELEPEELLREVLRDEPFWRNSGGGVTLSGGEATRQLQPIAALAARLHARGTHVLLETCGLYDGAAFEAQLLPHLDAVYFDVKLADPDAHRQHTGRDNRAIVENLERLARLAPGRLLPRVPLVPGITDGASNLQAIAALLRRLGIDRVAILPYNPLWIPKRLELGLELDYRHERFMSADEVTRCRELIQAPGLKVV
jgi:pyruvate formate lyase activating enzyme